MKPWVPSTDSARLSAARSRGFSKGDGDALYLHSVPVIDRHGRKLQAIPRFGEYIRLKLGQKQAVYARLAPRVSTASFNNLWVCARMWQDAILVVSQRELMSWAVRYLQITLLSR
jgi:hypothetical protein